MFKSINGGKLPTRGTKYSACVDVYANEDVIIGVGETWVIGVGIAIDIETMLNLVDSVRDITLRYSRLPNMYGGATIEEVLVPVKKGFMSSHYLQIALRSSLGKKGLILPNGVGIIDLDYEDEIKMIIYNPITFKSIIALVQNILSGFTKIIPKNEDFLIKKGDKIGQITLLEHKSYVFGIESNEERNGGFGSTGE